MASSPPRRTRRARAGPGVPGAAHAAPADPADAYRALLADVDGWFRRCHACFRDQMRCGRGCTECCQGLFDIDALDAALVRRGLAALPAADRAEIVARGRELTERLLALLPEVRASGRLDAVPEAEVDRAFDALGPVPCPFLGRQGECRIYESRPAVCRFQGLPILDPVEGPVHPEHCRLNFPTADPLAPANARRLAFDYRAFEARASGLLPVLQELTGEPGAGELQTCLPFVAAGIGFAPDLPPPLPRTGPGVGTGRRSPRNYP